VKTRFIEVNVNDHINEENREILTKITRLPVVFEALTRGAFISGGFARQILLNGNLRNYLQHPQRAGDIDFFFTSPEAAKAVIDFDESLHKSQGGFAKETHTMLNSLGLNVKLQFVNSPDLIFDTPEACMSRFDIYNCQVALVGGKLMFPHDWFELEDRRLLRINNTSAPFMGTRLLKYLTSRGYVGIEDQSRDALTEWLTRAATSTFPGFKADHLHGINHAVKELQKRGHIMSEDLVLFMGKWKKLLVEKQYGAYGVYTHAEVDWATHAIEQQRA